MESGEGGGLKKHYLKLNTVQSGYDGGCMVSQMSRVFLVASDHVIFNFCSVCLLADRPLVSEIGETKTKWWLAVLADMATIILMATIFS